MLSGLLERVTAERETRVFDGSINKVGLAQENFIVAGEGFLAVLSSRDFKNITWINRTPGRNFSILGASAENPTFVTCYGTSQALCMTCEKSSCQEAKSFPKFILNGFEIFQMHQKSPYLTLFLSNETLNENKYFLIQFRDSLPNILAELKVKPGWSYRVLQVYYVRDKKIAYALSQAEDEKKQKFDVMSDLGRSIYKEQPLNNNSCGSASLAVGNYEEGILFFGRPEALCVAYWKRITFLKKSLSTRFNVKGFEGSLTETKLMVEAVRGWNRSVLSSESVCSGYVVNEKQPSPLLLLGTKQGRIFKVRRLKFPRRSNSAYTGAVKIDFLYTGYFYTNRIFYTPKLGENWKIKILLC